MSDKLHLDFQTALDALDSKKEPHPQCVVRLTTSMWHDADGVYLKKSLKFLRRKCVGYNILFEDCYMMGADAVIPHIVNLDECKDGIYLVKTCNERHDWETPHIVDDYDYKLIPYE